MKNTSFNKKTETIKKIRITVSLLIVAVQIVTAQSNKFPTSGNVGIGTVNPLSTLHVNGGLRITGKSPNYAGPTLIFGASGNSSAENGNYNIEFIPNSGLNFSIPWPNSNFGNYDLFLSLNRRVGIGTGTPTEKLQVQGASSNVAIKINTGVANTSGARVSVASSAGSYKSVSANDFVLANINNNQGGILFNTQTGGVETNRMYIANAGNVGIGTTNPINNLHVYSTVNPAIRISSATSFFQFGLATNVGGYSHFAKVGDGVIRVLGGGDLFFAIPGTDESRKISFVTGGDEVLVVKESGKSANVGISTSSPTQKLDVNGSALIRSNLSVNGTTLIKGLDVNGSALIRNNLSINGADLMLGKSDGKAIGSKTAQRALVHADSDKLVVNYDGDFEGGTFIQGNKTVISGNLGIGTSSPKTKFHVESGANTDAAILATSTENNKLIVRSETTQPINVVTFKLLHEFGSDRNNGYIAFHRGSSTNAGFLSFGANGQEKMRVSNNGNIGIGTTSPTEKLQVQGASSNVAVRINTGVANTSGARVGVASSAGSYKSVSANDFVLANINNNQGGILFNTQTGGVETNRMYIANAGNLGIGTTKPDEKLTVNGNIHAKEVKVDLSIPADYVFQKYYTGSSALNPGYRIPTLGEVENYVKTNHHLPDMPSAGEIQEQGLKLGEMNNLLLQKVEELTLYTIEQDKESRDLKLKIQQQESQLKSQSAEIENLKSEIREIKTLLLKKHP